MIELDHEIEIEASPDEVYEALVTQVGLRRWWTADSPQSQRREALRRSDSPNAQPFFACASTNLIPAKGPVDMRGRVAGMDEYTSCLDYLDPGWSYQAPPHPRRPERYEQFLCFAQLNLGRTDVSAQVLRRREESWPALVGITSPTFGRKIFSH